MDRSKSILDVKIALAEKYEHLANCAKSRTRQRALAHRALKYRRQAAQLQHSSGTK